MRSVGPLAFSTLLALAGLSAIAAGCSATPPDRTPDPVVVPTAKATSDCPPGSTAAPCAKSASSGLAEAPNPCPEGPRCAGILAADEEAKLTTAIAAAQKAMLDSKYTDVHAMVELSRLQLRRDADTPEADGPTDAARSVKSATRAVAVDDAAAPPRLALALARARSLIGGKLLSDPLTRASALGAVDVALRAVPSTAGPTAAAAKTLEGYLALEKGNPAAAKAAFESATQLDPALGAAWMGLGDAARAAGDFDAAATAYKTAVTRLPDDPAAVRGLEAAIHKQALSLPPAPLASFPITFGPLAPAAPAPAKCPASVKAKDPGGPMCKALADLAKATTRDEIGRAAAAIIDGWNALQPVCDRHEKACGFFVAPALVAASRAYQSAGKLAKSIAAALIVVHMSDLPGQPGALLPLSLELGDRYLGVGMLDSAADYYTKHLQLTGKSKGPVVERALALRLALGNADAAMTLAADFARDGEAKAADRASALVATAALVRANKDPSAAVQWLGGYKEILEQGGMKDAVTELSKPLPPPAASECASPLACAIRRLAGDPRWTQ